MNMTKIRLQTQGSKDECTPDEMQTINQAIFNSAFCYGTSVFEFAGVEFQMIATTSNFYIKKMDTGLTKYSDLETIRGLGIGLSPGTIRSIALCLKQMILQDALTIA